MLNKKILSLAVVLAPMFTAIAFADGDVQVAFDPVSRELRLTGDGAANDVVITQDVEGSFTVTGRNGTTVNLLPSVTTVNVRSLNVDLGDGGDTIQINDAAVSGGLRVRMGDGANTLAMRGVRIRGRTAIRGGGGADHVIADVTSVFLGTFGAVMGGGNDNVELLQSVHKKRVTIRTGGGMNTVLVQGASLERAASLTVNCGDEDDNLRIDNSALDNDVNVNMRGGDDHVTLTDSRFGNDLSVNGGGGNNDNLSFRSGNDFDRVPQFRSFEE